MADRIIYRVCPFLAASVVIGSIYWTAVTYGALTVMQAVGAKEGLALMEQSDPLFLLVGLPTVPIMLILGRLVRWEEALLTFLNKNIPRVPVVKRLLPAFQLPGSNGSSGVNNVRPGGVDLPHFSDPVSATRVLCGALIFPSMAVLVGKIVFHPLRSNLQRTLYVIKFYDTFLHDFLTDFLFYFTGRTYVFGPERSSKNLLQAANAYQTVQAACSGFCQGAKRRFNQ